MAPDQRAERRDSEQHIAEHGKPGGWHVDEYDLRGFALLIVGGRNEKREIEADSQQDQRQRREPGHHPVDEAQKTRRIGEADHGGWSSGFVVEVQLPGLFLDHAAFRRRLPQQRANLSNGRAASSWPGIWLRPDAEPPWWSANGSEAPVPTSPAWRARTRFGPPGPRISCTTPPSTA